MHFLEAGGEIVIELDLAGGFGMVAGPPQAGPLGRVAAVPHGGVAEGVDIRGIDPGHEAGATRSADRTLAVGVLEDNPPGGNPVEVGRLDQGMAGIARVTKGMLVGTDQRGRWGGRATLRLETVRRRRCPRPGFGQNLGGIAWTRFLPRAMRGRQPKEPGGDAPGTARLQPLLMSTTWSFRVQ